MPLAVIRSALGVEYKGRISANSPYGVFTHESGTYYGGYLLVKPAKQVTLEKELDRLETKLRAVSLHSAMHILCVCLHSWHLLCFEVLSLLESGLVKWIAGGPHRAYACAPRRGRCGNRAGETRNGRGEEKERTGGSTSDQA